MRRLIATGLTTALLLGAALPAVAGTDTLQQLEQAMNQEQAETGPAAPPAFSLDGLLPDAELVQMEVDLEDGLTAEERFASYITSAQMAVHASPHDLFALAKLGIAYRLAGRAAEARPALEQAVAEEPSAGSLYDELARLYAQVQPGITVFVSGHPVKFDVQPVIQNGRTLVPIRAVAEAMGATIDWNPDTETATVKLGARTVTITEGALVAQVDGKPVTLDVPATIIDGRTLLPLRFVSENLNHLVGYHPASVDGTAVIEINRP